MGCVPLNCNISQNNNLQWCFFSTESLGQLCSFKVSKRRKRWPGGNVPLNIITFPVMGLNQEWGIKPPGSENHGRGFRFVPERVIMEVSDGGSKDRETQTWGEYQNLYLPAGWLPDFNAPGFRKHVIETHYKLSGFAGSAWFPSTSWIKPGLKWGAFIQSSPSGGNVNPEMYV